MKTAEQIKRQFAENNTGSKFVEASEKQISEYLSSNNVTVEEKEFAENCKASLISLNGEKAMIVIQANGNEDGCIPSDISWENLLGEFNNL